MQLNINNQFQRRIDNLLDRKLSSAVDFVVDNTKRALPRNSGRLAASVEKRKAGEMSYEWGSDLDYASFVEYGTINQQPDGTWRRELQKSTTGMRNKFKG